MKLLLVLCILPVALAGNYAKMWAELESQVKDKMDDKPDDSMDHGWNQEHKGWGGDKKKRWGDDKEDDDDGEESMKEKLQDFKQFMKRKELKEREDREAKAEIYKEIERVQIKKLLADKLETMTTAFEMQRQKFVFQTVWHFLSLCPGDGDPKSFIEKYDVSNFADDPMDIMNDTSISNNSSSSNSNSTSPSNGGLDDDTKVKWYVDMEPETKFKYLIKGFVMKMCQGAQMLVGEVQMLESRINECKLARSGCDLFP